MPRPDVLLTSPLPRAQEAAEIAAHGPSMPGRLIWFLDPRVLRTLADPRRGTRTAPAANGHALRKEVS